MENNSPIKIEKARPEDAENIIRLLYTTWLATYPNKEHGITVEDIHESHMGALTPERIEGLAKRIREISSTDERLVAKSGDKIIGVTRMIRHESNNQLQMIYVLPAYQGKGIGTTLYEKAIEFADPSKDTIVQVATYNIQAIKFYEKLGFRDNGKRFSEEQFRMKSGAIIPEMEMVLKAK